MQAAELGAPNAGAPLLLTTDALEIATGGVLGAMGEKESLVTSHYNSLGHQLIALRLIKASQYRERFT